MVLLAFSLQDQVEKYGAYVGIAAFFGLAVLSLLYFAQAREVKRLREWAGRAPERAAELEAAVAEHAQEVAQRPATPTPAPQPVAATPQPAVANGAVKLKPAEIAALAFARAAGVHEPHEPKAHPVPAATVAAPAAPSRTVEAPPTEVAAAGAAVAAGEPAAAQALAPSGTNGGGSGTPPPKPAPATPPPATPAARRAEPAPLPPRRPVPPTRRTAPPPPRRESNVRSVVITAIVGVLVLAGTAFGLTSLLGGDEEPSNPPPIATTPPEEGEATATAEPVTKDNAQVMVFNGTSQAGLAGNFQSQLIGEGYPEANVAAETLGEAEQRQTSVVMYRGGSARRAAQEIGTAIGVEQVERLDAATQTALKSLPADKQKDWNVVVIVGVDKSTQ